MLPRSLALCALILGLAGCASVARVDAAEDVHALLLAVRDGDQAAFDAHIDRPALRTQIEAFLVQRARQSGNDTVRGLAMLLAGSAAKAASDVVLRPQVFRAAAEYYGYTPDRPIPGPLAIVAALRPAGQGEVCAARGKDGPCFLTFAREDGTWKLIRFDGDPSQLRLP